jgi:uncharacterized protein YcgI (DUF1989 family)
MTEIPARYGKGARVGRGAMIRAVNTTGKQAVELCAFSAADLREFMSMDRSRVAAGTSSRKGR